MKTTRHLLRILAAFSVMAAAWFFAADLPDGVLALETKTLHLGKAGQYEWESYKDVPVDAEALVLHFDAKANDKE
ncbi:MAG: hypothetical protein ACAH88_06325, partial [Roseimicrobium sp.]